MTDAAQAATAAPTSAALPATGPISLAEGVARFKAVKAADAPTANPISDAARTLGQRAREAREQRQAEQPRKPENVALSGDGGDVEDDPTAQAGETQDEIDTATGEQPNEANTGADEDEPGEGQTIDLGDGVNVTVDEVRDNFMMKADYTRKTQSLAQERQHFEVDRSQRVDFLDKMLGAAKQMLPEFEPVHILMDRLGDGPGMREFGRQQALLQQIGTLEAARQQEQAHHSKQLRDATVKALADKHGDKAAAHYDGAVKVASEWTGMQPDYLATMMAHPAIPDIVHDAKAWRDLQASKGNVQRKVADKPRVTRPGARVSTQAAGQQQIQNAHAKLKSSGNVADAVAFWRLTKAQGKRG